LTGVAPPPPPHPNNTAMQTISNPATNFFISKPSLEYRQLNWTKLKMSA
jgi:hypothetical protein